MRKIILFGVFVCAGAYSAQKTCNLDNLTNKCEDFGKNSPDIFKFADGSIMPNFAKLGLKKNDDQESQGSAVAEEEQQNLDAEQKRYKIIGKIHEQLNKVPNAKMNLRAKMYYDSSQFNRLLNAESGEKIAVLWPLNSSRAKIQKVPQEAVFDALQSALGRQGLDKVFDSVDQLGEISDARPQRSRYPKAIVRATQPTPKSIKKVEALFKYAQKKMQNLILKGRTEGELSIQERSLLARVKHTSLSPASEGGQRAACKGIAPNAFYMAETNKVVLCSSVYNYPPASILATLSHEIGHSIDPCGSQSGLMKINSRKIEDFDTKDSNLSKSLKKLITHAQNVAMGSSDIVGVPLGTSPQDLQTLKSLGLIQPLAAGTALAEYPLLPVYQCFKSKEGGAFRGLGQKEYRAMSKKIAKVKRLALGSSYDAVKGQKRIFKSLMKSPECIDDPTKRSRMGEVMSDWLGDQVVKSYLAENPPQTKLEKMAPILSFAVFACAGRLSAKENTDRPETERLYSYMDAMKATGDEHPNTVKRIERITLSDPVFAKILNCKPISKVNCGNADKRDRAAVTLSSPRGGTR